MKNLVARPAVRRFWESVGLSLLPANQSARAGTLTWGGALRLFTLACHCLGGALGRALCLVTLLECLRRLLEQRQLHRAYELRQRSDIVRVAVQRINIIGGAAWLCCTSVLACTLLAAHSTNVRPLSEAEGVLSACQRHSMLLQVMQDWLLDSILYHISPKQSRVPGQMLTGKA